MRRIFLMVTVAAVMVVAMALAGAPAFASSQVHNNNIGNHATAICTGGTCANNGRIDVNSV